MKKIIIAIIISTLIQGCGRDFLDEENKSLVDLRTQSGAQGALYEAYENLRLISGSHQATGRTYFLLTEVTSDNFITQSDKGIRRALDAYFFDASNENFQEYWEECYFGIAQANLVISNVQNTDLEEKDRLIAEARFIRAYINFNLVRMFENIPLLTEPIEKDEAIPQSNQDEVYALIIEDLEFGLNNLMEYDGTNFSNATVEAAHSLLARVYLTRASTFDNPADYQKALDHAMAVVNSGKFDLLTDPGRYPSAYEHLFRPESNWSKEAIMGISVTDLIKKGINGAAFNFASRTDLFGRVGSGQIGMDPNFYDVFGQDDERRQSIINQEFTVLNSELDSVGTATTKSKNFEFVAPYITKWQDPFSIGKKSDLTSYYLFRYAEILLIIAEAENELNGPTELAYNSLNAIRNRAGLDDLSSLSQEAFRTALLSDRRKELMGEGHRWFDLKRLGMLEEAVEATKAGPNWEEQPDVKEKHYVFPIPQSALNTNPLLKQNPGY